jgi:molybdopterin molybdotransferase
MIEVAAAREIVLQHAKPLPAEMTAAMSSSLGQVLAADIAADLDSPPFDKSMMDGYAIHTADVPGGFGVLRLSGQIAAGQAASLTLHTATAIRIFTGAPIPKGANAVVMQERTTLQGDDVTVNDPGITTGKNILRRGAEMKAGDIALPAGTLLTPAAFGLLAAVGKTTVPAYPRPKVCVLATGDELVEARKTPGPGQIRNTNGPMLMAQAARAGALPRYLGIAPDDETALKSYISEGLTTSNVLVLAGGVSVGKLDLVPNVLADLGVQSHFHKVRMKPGKPLFFGTRGEVMVFGLPGNPVSAFVGFELFVRPALRVLAGHADRHVIERLPLTKPLTANHDRPTYHPAKLAANGIEPLPWFGSPDLRGMLNADAFILIPPGEVKFEAGTDVDVMRIEG